MAAMAPAGMTGLFHLHIRLQTELLKRLAEVQCKASKGHSGGWTTRIQSAANDPLPLYSTQSRAAKAML